MRKLTSKQKSFLRDMVDKGFRIIDDFENGEFGELEAMNDYETLYQDAERFMHDYLFSKEK